MVKWFDSSHHQTVDCDDSASIGRRNLRDLKSRGRSRSTVISLLMLLQLQLSATLASYENTWNCTGVPNGVFTCSGCSPQFANGGTCEGCLAETLNLGPVCRECQSGEATGSYRGASCQPACFYCLDCDLQKLSAIGGQYNGVDTCRCNVDLLRQAYGSGGRHASSSDFFDGRYGIIKVGLGKNLSGTINDCRVDVGCLPRGRRHVMTLHSKKCATVTVAVPTTKVVDTEKLPHSTGVLVIINQSVNLTGTASDLDAAKYTVDVVAQKSGTGVGFWQTKHSSSRSDSTRRSESSLGRLTVAAVLLRLAYI